MKKLIILSGIIAVMFTGCEVHPYASFQIREGNTVQPFDVITFSNYSSHAVAYEWDFGDGTYSDLKNPQHSYEYEGIYTISLRAISEDNNVDVAYMDIEVIYTLLEITVVEWNPDEHIDWLIEDAFVLLYPTRDAWLNDYDVIAYGYTDNHGVITFAGLEERYYWVWAEKVPASYLETDGYDNYSFYLDGYDSYIKTPVLVPFALNTWIAWVHYFDPYQSPDKAIKKNRHEKYAKNKIISDSTSFIIVGATE